MSVHKGQVVVAIGAAGGVRVGTGVGAAAAGGGYVCQHAGVFTTHQAGGGKAADVLQAAVVGGVITRVTVSPSATSLVVPLISTAVSSLRSPRVTSSVPAVASSSPLSLSLTGLPLRSSATAKATWLTPRPP
nr:hypothetical protein [Halomonas sp. N3-2A]